MDDSALVCVFERIRDLSGDSDRFIHRNRTSFHAISKSWAFHQLHH